MSEQEKQQQPQQEAAGQAENGAPINEPAREDEARNAEGGSPGAVDLESQLVDAHQRLAALEKALSEADIRAQAEIQNVRRRAERDVDGARKFALEKFAGDLLTVADSLERGLSTLDPDNQALAPAREGLELTLKVLLDVFNRYNLEQIDPQGQPFNPEHHEAMTMVPAPDAEPNTVIEVLEKGYQLNGRLIRPARVVVSKAPG
ncbi:nucleotide exchange factor GrpE [Alloalcanivorax mobilis]|uniref:nucleotide exchange factor GrpE n=1 Tax=Alloalcanivorax mobilis TaxID=2019569 RepID=UPI000C762B75|nr:nucleotide exchange factor GrpE [Alloalcanivorax mobilis]